jgi:hypothetical protein
MTAILSIAFQTVKSGMGETAVCKGEAISDPSFRVAGGQD